MRVELTEVFGAQRGTAPIEPSCKARAKLRRQQRASPTNSQIADANDASRLRMAAQDSKVAKATPVPAPAPVYHTVSSALLHPASQA